MIDQFFEEKVQADFYANQRLIQLIIDEDLISDAPIRRLLCHIINTQHIWIARLEGTISESSEWDDLPSSHWLSLNQENFQRLSELVVNNEVSNDFYKLVDHSLNYAVYIRGQIAVYLKQHEITPPPFNLVTLE